MSRDIDMRCVSCGRPYNPNPTGTLTGCVCGNSTFRGLVTVTPTDGNDVHLGGLVESDPRTPDAKEET